MKIADWITRIIDGPAGMNSFEQHELVIWQCSECAAWEKIADGMASWATTFGSLTLFWRLRRKRDD